ncbi:M24 family metallopeptidase [Ornithinibacillus halotolerans]|uniref:Dipeptidase YkvY n=1 Tax=Ornithinibacillus halotolerans TaxID=1274357 RepID=A0A916S3W1_9BACI|nr:Xaa-Pro peptidase family protein [Ornithinibacillus halotolerans]GGA82164.1 putative dipeptidase YkvY [Ornithinibacillus halotolerans]
MSNRMEALVQELSKNQLDSILITSPANIYYVSNYYTDPHERVVAVYATLHHDPILILPAMEAEDAKAAGWSYAMIDYHDHENPWELFLTFLKENGKIPQSLGVEEDYLSLSRYSSLKEILPSTEIKNAQEVLALLRVIKTTNEYESLKKAAELADFGIQTGIQALKEGITELEVIAEIEYELKKQGVQAMSFSTMVLFGDKAASPHGTPGSRKLVPGDLVLFDLGVIYEGYCSDITRTVAYKSVNEEQQKIYNTVLEGQLKAIEASLLGNAVGNIDKAARDHIESCGYGQYFNHRIGHGLGIETHEYPSLHGNNTLPLQEGMCYTIEPGIYVPKVAGVRIEDMIFMTKDGAEILTKFPKELQIIE